MRKKTLSNRYGCLETCKNKRAHLSQSEVKNNPTEPWQSYGSAARLRMPPWNVALRWCNKCLLFRTHAYSPQGGCRNTKGQLLSLYMLINQNEVLQQSLLPCTMPAKANSAQAGVWKTLPAFERELLDIWTWDSTVDPFQFYLLNLNHKGVVVWVLNTGLDINSLRYLSFGHIMFTCLPMSRHKSQ